MSSISVERIQIDRSRIDGRGLFQAPTEISAPGHRIVVDWAPVAGATTAEVSTAAITLHPSVVEESSAGVPLKADGAGWVATVPAKKRVRAIALFGFRQPAGEELISSLPGGMRISIAFPKQEGGGFESPRFSVPAVSAKNEAPSTLTGASFSNRVITLSPAPAGSRIRFALVSGPNPPEFEEQPTELSSVNLTTHTTAKNATVVIDEGEPQWQMPEFEPGSPGTDVDLRAGLETALNRKLKEQQAPQAAITISADAPANMIVQVSTPRGFLVRTEAGVLKAVVEGDPVTLSLALPLAGEVPSSVTGDLTIHYSGVRILEEVSDPLPAPGAAQNGVIVGTDSAVRVFPAEALQGLDLARVGVYGRAPEDCEISLEFVRMIGNTAGNTLAPPAVLKLEQGAGMRTHWAAFPRGTRIDGPTGLRLRANRGRFFWVTTDAGNPLVRVAINDPDPGGRRVNLGGARLTDVTAAEFHAPAFAFPPAAFQGAAPMIESGLFLTIEFSDLTLRYAR
jgi:hypothetical protein